MSLFGALLVGLVMGILIGRRGPHVFQNRGEERLARALQRRFAGPDYHLLNHVTLRTADGTTQVDHILVSRFGVFVIETKDYRGWIFARAEDRYWTQVMYRAKFRFQNPIRQNFKHARAVQDLLDFLPATAIQPLVVFTGDAEFRTPVPEGVFALDEVLSFIECQRGEVMSVNRVQFAVGRLETARLSLTQETDVEHVRRLERRFGREWTG